MLNLSTLAGSLDLATALDEMECAMLRYPQADCPVVHRFTPGLYVREITMPKGSMITSMEHNTQHPFVISKGSVQVISENEGPVTYTAPYCGITQPGTRRILRILEDTVWTTFHPTQETDIEKIAEEILVPHINPLLGEGNQSNNQWRISLPPSILNS